jgi:hypothetical protein
MERKLAHKEIYLNNGKEYEIRVFMENDGILSVQSFFNGVSANAYRYSISPSEATGKFNWQENKEYIVERLVNIAKNDIDRNFGIIS